MTVRVHSNIDLRMAQQVADRFHMFSLRQQERCTAMAQVVKPDGVGQSCSFQHTLEMPYQVARREWCPYPTGKNQSMFAPVFSPGLTFLALVFLMLLQLRYQTIRQFNCSHTRFCLTLTNLKYPPFHIHIVPPEREDLPLAHPQADGYPIERLQPMPRNRLEQRSCLLYGQKCRFVGANLWHFHECGDIPRNGAVLKICYNAEGICHKRKRSTMSIRLIYHALENQEGNISPFDEAITEIVSGQDTWIACPYLGLDYLNRIISLSRSWRVLTDVEEWLKVHTISERPSIQQFIEEHQQAIHHVKDLHAKIIIAGPRVLLGSANFTRKGITERTEISVLFENEPYADELRQWFETLWSQSSPVETAELHTCIDSLPHKSSAGFKAKSSLSSYPHPVRSRLKPLASKTIPVVAIQDIDAHLLLIERVKRAPDREWINGYFDLMKRVINATGLTNEDPRLVTSIRKGKGLFPMSINNRWVLSPCKENGEWYIRIIYGSEFEYLQNPLASVSHCSRFDALSGEGTDTPFLPYFKDIGILLEGSWDKGWLSAAKAELTRARASPYRRHHQPVVYEAAVNLEYRILVLDEAFK